MSFARRYYCYLLIYCEQFSSSTMAIEREKEIKDMNRRLKEELIISINSEWGIGLLFNTSSYYVENWSLGAITKEVPSEWRWFTLCKFLTIDSLANKKQWGSYSELYFSLLKRFLLNDTGLLLAFVGGPSRQRILSSMPSQQTKKETP